MVLKLTSLAVIPSLTLGESNTLKAVTPSLTRGIRSFKQIRSTEALHSLCFAIIRSLLLSNCRRQWLKRFALTRGSSKARGAKAPGSDHPPPARESGGTL